MEVIKGMWISKKRIKQLEKKIADLEVQVQSQLRVKCVSTVTMDSESVNIICKELDRRIDGNKVNINT